MPGLQEMLVIGVVALLVFGPDRLPEVAKNVGKFVGKLRSETQRNMNELKDMSEIRDLQRELQDLRRDLSGVTDEFKGPLRGGSSTKGPTRRMAPTSTDGGRALPDGDVPPPTDPDAT